MILLGVDKRSEKIMWIENSHFGLAAHESWIRIQRMSLIIVDQLLKLTFRLLCALDHADFHDRPLQDPSGSILGQLS